MSTCRCGYNGEGDHPCHGNGYRCRKTAKRRFYNPQPVGLAGLQMKLQVSDTWACDECWAAFQQELGADGGINGYGHLAHSGR